MKANLIIFKIDDLLYDCALTSDGTMIGNCHQFDCIDYDYLLPDQILFACFDQSANTSAGICSFSIANTDITCTIKDVINNGKMQQIVKHLFDSIQDGN